MYAPLRGHDWRRSSACSAAADVTLPGGVSTADENQLTRHAFTRREGLKVHLHTLSCISSLHAWHVNDASRMSRSPEQAAPEPCLHASDPAWILAQVRAMCCACTTACKGALLQASP